MLKVQVPRQLNVDSMYSLIGSALDQRGTPRADRISFDFTDLEFVDVVGVTVLSNLIERLQKRHVAVEFEGCERRYEGVRYLDDCGFFLEYQGCGLSALTQLRSTTYPFRKLTCEQSHHFLDGDLIPWLAGKLDVHVSSLHSFKTCIREIFNNIQDHSSEQIGCMHMQVYPRADEVVVAVSDFGVGIPTVVRRVQSAVTDFDALALAVTEGFTSKSTAKNMGAGLNYLIRTVVQQNRGFVRIHSGLAKISFNYGQASPTGGTTLGLYPGTLISMMLPKENLPEPDEEGSEEVSW